MARLPKFSTVAELDAYVAQLKEQRSELLTRSDREIGEIVRKVGLAETDRNILYGAFLYLVETIKAQPQLEKEFAEKGAAFLAKN